MKKYKSYIERLGFKNVTFYEIIQDSEEVFAVYYDALFDKSKVEVMIQCDKKGKRVKYRFLKSNDWIDIEELNEVEILQDEVFGSI